MQYLSCFDHPLQAAHLTFDPPQPLQVVVLVVGVSVHAASTSPRLRPHRREYYTPARYISMRADVLTGSCSARFWRRSFTRDPTVSPAAQSSRDDSGREER